MALEMGRQTFFSPFFLSFLKAKLLPEATTTAFGVEETGKEGEEKSHHHQRHQQTETEKQQQQQRQTKTDKREDSFTSFLSFSLACPMFVQCWSYKRATHQKEAAIKLDCCTTQHKKQTHTQHKQTTHKVLEQFNLLPPPNAAKAIENRHRRFFFKKCIQSTTQLMDRTDSAVPN